MNAKKPYVKPVLKKQQRLCEVAEGGPAVVTGVPVG